MQEIRNQTLKVYKHLLTETPLVDHLTIEISDTRKPLGIGVLNIQPGGRFFWQVLDRPHALSTLGQGGDKELSVAFCEYPAIQDDHHAPVGFGADQAAKPLAEA